MNYKNIYKVLFVFIFIFSFFGHTFSAVTSDPNAGLTPGNTDPLTGTELNLNSEASSGSGRACSDGSVDTVAEVFQYGLCLLGDFVVPMIISIALLMFVIGIVKYVTSGGNEERKDAGKGLMVFGIIALFVMTMFWGFVRFLHNSFFEGELTMPSLPNTQNDLFR